MFHHSQPPDTRKTSRRPVSCLTLTAVLIICLAFAAPAAATPDDATVFSGGTFASASDLVAAINDPNTATVSGAVITLHKDLNITGTVELTGSMTLLGGGHTIWRGGNDFYLINVTSGTLTLGDGTSQLTVHGQNEKYSTDNRFGSILVNGSGTKLVMKNEVTLKNTTLKGASYVGLGGAVFVDTGAAFEMQGGLIINNTACQYGGGIYNKDGTVTISGGKISGNTAIDGGGIYIYYGTVTISGGEISGNTATTRRGGGIHNSEGTLTISGGEISGNTAGLHGGGIYTGHIYGGAVTISGGEISGNTAKFSGGGIYISNRDGTVTISGGTISGNTATQNGGGISIDEGTFTISGGEISGNTATQNGGGIHIGSTTTLIMSYGTISDNTASSGGGIYLYYGKLTLSGGEISGNTATQNGGGIYLYGGTLTISGGEISGNTATQNGGGIHYDGGTLTLSGNANVTGNDMYLGSGKYITVPAAFTGSVNNITGHSSVIAPGYQLVRMQGDIQAPTVLGKFRIGNSTLALMVNTTTNTLDVDKPMPEVASASIVPYNSTAANITFTLSDRTDTLDAPDGAYVNLTQGNVVISKLFSENIAKGETVSDVQLTGLTPGVSYQLNITPLNKPSGGTPRIFTYSGFIAGVPDTLNLTVYQTHLRLGSGTAVFTAILTNSASGTQYDNVAVRISDGTGTIAASGITGSPITWKPTVPGVHTLTAVVTVSGTDIPSNPVSVTVTVPEGSSGGGGGDGIITAIIDDFGNADLRQATGIISVSFAKGTTGTVTLDPKPTGVTGPEKTHKLAEINAPSFNGSAEIAFAVPVSVLRDQGLSVNDVVMQHYVNGKWVKLPTFYVGEDRGAAKYIAQTPSFSPFAIVYETGGAQIVERSTPQPTKDAGTDVTGTAKPTATETSTETSATAVPTTSVATGGASAVPTMTQAPVPVAGVLLGLLAAAGVLMRKRE